MSENDAGPRIEIPGDTLVLDKEFCREVLDDCHVRTARRYEREGLPFVLVNGRKFRPLNAGREWLKSRIISTAPKRKKG